MGIIYCQTKSEQMLTSSIDALMAKPEMERSLKATVSIVDKKLELGRQYAPVPRINAGIVFRAIRRSSAGDQFSM